MVFCLFSKDFLELGYIYFENIFGWTCFEIITFDDVESRFLSRKICLKIERFTTRLPSPTFRNRKT